MLSKLTESNFHKKTLLFFGEVFFCGKINSVHIFLNHFSQRGWTIKKAKKIGEMIAVKIAKRMYSKSLKIFLIISIS